MSAPPVAPPALALDGTVGVIQVGLVLATWLFGIETLQTFNYYRDFGKDPKVLRGLVGAIWYDQAVFLHPYRCLNRTTHRLFELAHTISGWHAMYTITVTFYGKPQHIISPPLSMTFPILFHAFIAMAVQTFFVYRIRVVSGQWLIPVTCFILNLGRMACLLFLFQGWPIQNSSVQSADDYTANGRTCTHQLNTMCRIHIDVSWRPAFKGLATSRIPNWATVEPVGTGGQLSIDLASI
ncbi:hypothetical protein DFH06DRAFT_1439272 [Mycena polygramma]|nr:hypothetical protein DFH06DRAFT_1439272 [Mycena polygramma]